MEPAVTPVSAKARATSVAHPERRLFGGVVSREGAVLVCMVARVKSEKNIPRGGKEYSLSTADHHDALFHQRIPEARIVRWRCDALSPFALEILLGLSILR